MHWPLSLCRMESVSSRPLTRLRPRAVLDYPPLATALVAALAGPQVRIEELLAAIRTKFPATSVAIHMPGHPGFLAGAPWVPAASACTAHAAAAGCLAAISSTRSPRARATSKLPDEPAMSDAERRKVQTALARLGYYAIQVDGIFGPETRAAIRRYQHEIW